MGSISTISPSKVISILSNSELDKLISQWRKLDIDLDTLLIVDTMDPGKFSQTNFMPPIVTSTVFNTTIESRLADPPSAEFFYSRYANPTRSHLESVVAKMDSANYALTYSSGQAAIAAVFQACCAKDDHVIYVQSISGDTHWLFKNKLPSFGIEFDEVFPRNTQDIVSHIKPNTKIIILECPSNPLLEMLDIRALSIEAQTINPNVLIVVDNSILTPIFQRPSDFGADVVVYSLTKYFAGYADVMMGSVVCNSKQLYEAFKNTQIFFGAIPSPRDCYLMIRSLKSYILRMDRHFKSAMKIAYYLESHPAVTKIFFPGLKSYPQYDLVLQQTTGVSGLISFYIQGHLEEATIFIKELKHFRHGGSFASDVSIVCLPSITSQRQMIKDERAHVGIADNLLRISVGLESVEVLVHDLDQALNKAVKAFV